MVAREICSPEPDTAAGENAELDQISSSRFPDLLFVRLDGISQQTSGCNEAKQYIGQYEDPETNLSHLQTRYSGASKGEFVSEDPMLLGNLSSKS